MAPIIEVSDKTLRTLNPEVYKVRTDLISKLKVEAKPKPETPRIEVRDNNYIEIPGLNLEVAKQLTHKGKSAIEQKQALTAEGFRMLSFFEGAEFANYLLSHPDNQEYQEILARMKGKHGWQGENFDDHYEKDSKGILWVRRIGETKKSRLVGGLRENRAPGIDFEKGWIRNHTKQGLPRANAKPGETYFFKATDGYSAGLGANQDGAGLGCVRGPGYRYASIGVRVAKQLK